MEKIYYADIETPVGAIWAVQSNKGLMRLNFPCEEKKLLSDVAKHTETEPEYRPSKLDELDSWLTKYFKGENSPYKEKFDLRGTAFQNKVWRTLFKVPYGKLISYGHLAKKIGKPKASRAVGNAVGENPLAIVIPCHRVVRGNGGIGGFGGGLPVKRILLNVEGVLDSSEGVPEKGIDLRKFF
jgi:methylated-DNA-[protein]-cysteine S-methyltransferase